MPHALFLLVSTESLVEQILSNSPALSLLEKSKGGGMHSRRENNRPLPGPCGMGEMVRETFSRRGSLWIKEVPSASSQLDFDYERQAISYRGWETWHTFWEREWMEWVPCSWWSNSTASSVWSLRCPLDIPRRKKVTQCEAQELWSGNINLRVINLHSQQFLGSGAIESHLWRTAKGKMPGPDQLNQNPRG